ncbi:Rha family transcriptional regulator [Agrobacterium sp. CMT1]|uniref:Rha family transcriptional regulator n=1 Tax=Agrobacterium sp. CMT1 TaxID=3128901 RepID=UPI0030771E0B
MTTKGAALSGPSVAPDAIPEVCRAVPFMSSLEIAAMTGKRHSDVLRDIQRELSKIGEDERKFASVYLAGNGERRPCYCLPGTYLLFIASAYDAKLRFQIIQHWEALNNGTAQPVKDAANVLVQRLVNGGRKARVLELQEAHQHARLEGRLLTARERNLILLP